VGFIIIGGIIVVVVVEWWWDEKGGRRRTHEFYKLMPHFEPYQAESISYFPCSSSYSPRLGLAPFCRPACGEQRSQTQGGLSSTRDGPVWGGAGGSKVRFLVWKVYECMFCRISKWKTRHRKKNGREI
jgi:hypothetical protein